MERETRRRSIIEWVGRAIVMGVRCGVQTGVMCIFSEANHSCYVCMECVCV